MTELEKRQLKFLKYSHLVAGIIHIGSSAFLLGYTADGNTWTPALELPRDVWTEITTGECNDTFTGRCFRQERSYETYGIDLAALCAVFAFWSGFLHLLVFSPFYQKYKETIRKKFGFWRWLDYTISASIMIVVIAIYCGITDTFLLASLGLLEATVILLGAGSEWALSKAPKKFKSDDTESEEESDGTKNPALQKLSKYLLVLAFLLFALMWVPILSTFFLSISSAENVPAVVYIVVFTYPLSFLFFGLVSLQIYRKNMRNYLWYEFNFILLSLVSKVLLHWSIFFALLMRGEQLENDQFERNSPGTVDENSLYGVIGGVLACGVVTALVASRYWPKDNKDNNSVGGKVISNARVVQTYTFW